MYVCVTVDRCFSSCCSFYEETLKYIDCGYISVPAITHFFPSHGILVGFYELVCVLFVLSILNAARLLHYL